MEFKDVSKLRDSPIRQSPNLMLYMLDGSLCTPIVTTFVEGFKIGLQKSWDCSTHC